MPATPHGEEGWEMHEEQWKDLKCEVCQSGEDDANLLLCDYCNLVRPLFFLLSSASLFQGYHMYCLRPPVESVPEGNWYCETCNEELLGSNHSDKTTALTRVWFAPPLKILLSILTRFRGSLPNLLPMPRVPMSGSLYEVLPSETFSVVDWAQFKLNLIPPPVTKVDAGGASVPHTPRMFLLAPTYRFPMFPAVAPFVLRSLQQPRPGQPPRSGPPPASPNPMTPNGSFSAPPPVPRGRASSRGRKATSAPSSPAPPPPSAASPSPFEEEQKRHVRSAPSVPQPPPSQFGSFPPQQEEAPLVDAETSQRLSLDRVQVTPLRSLEQPGEHFDASMSYLDPRHFQDF